MTSNWPLYLTFVAVITLLVKPLGLYMACVFGDGPAPLAQWLGPVERLFYRLAGVDPDQDMSWQQYCALFVVFTVLGSLAVFAVMYWQAGLPLAGLIDAQYLQTPLTVDLALNTGISFATTTTWQAYGGESTLSYFGQCLGLVAQNFLAGALGLAVGIAFIRGLARQSAAGLGNFWRDMVRGLLWVLLPLGLLGSLVLVWQGVPMNFAAYTKLTTMEGASQVIAQGPVAALEFIKNLGTNGGGFFNVNGAHPLANPTPLTNFLGMLAIVALPAALTYTYGRMVQRQRDGWILYAVMTAFFVLGLGLCDRAESGRQAAWHDVAGVEATGNWEGKETRFGIGHSVLAAVATSNGATGSYNAMLDSFTPLGGLVPLANMLFGEVVFGGLGTGLYSMIFCVLLAVFIGSLMAGRAPEFLGKQIGPAHLKLIAGYSLVAPATILILSAVALTSRLGQAGLTTNRGAHGLTEILVAYTSAFANNGLSFAGLNANTPFYNITTAIAMLAGRVVLTVFALALAGSMAQQTVRAQRATTLPTDSWEFALLLVSTIVIIGGLSFLPAISLGPLLEQWQVIFEEASCDYRAVAEVGARSAAKLASLFIANGNHRWPFSGGLVGPIPRAFP